MSALTAIQTGVAVRPPRLLVYGVPGVGKTTFASAAPSPVFLQTEEGADTVGAARFPLAKSLSEVNAAIDSLLHEQHDFATLVLDSLDELETLVHTHLCQQYGAKSITDEHCKAFTYGKGYTIAAQEMATLRDKLTKLRNERGMAIILVAHSHVQRFEDPEHDPYDRYQPKLHKTAVALWTQWSDAVLFAHYQIYTKSKDVGFNKEHTRALTSGERILSTTEKPSHIAKNRWGLPDELPLSWGAFSQALTNGMAPKA